MIIQDLSDDHATAFQTLRLFGLRGSPTSFGSSYEEEHSRTDQQIVAHLVGPPERKFLGRFNDSESTLRLSPWKPSGFFPSAPKLDHPCSFNFSNTG